MPGFFKLIFVLCAMACAEARAEQLPAVVWTRTYNSFPNMADTARDLAVDSSGNVYVCGEENRTADLGTGLDVRVIKYSSNGEFVWTISHNNPANTNDKCYAIAADSSDNIFMVSSENRADLGQGLDMRVAKYNKHGFLSAQYTISRDYFGTENDEALAAAVDPAGNVYVAGYYTDTGVEYPYVVKLSSSLGLDWFADYSTHSARATGVAVDAQGSVFVAGYADRGDVSEGLNSFLMKFNPDGLPQWTTFYNCNGGQDDYAARVAVDPSGDVYVVGYEDRTDLGRDMDARLLKYNTDGLLQWTTSYNGPDSRGDYGYSLSVDELGEVYVAGLSDSLGSGGDVLLLKYSPSGELRWTKTYDSPNNNWDLGYAIKAVSPRVFYAAGTVYSADPAQDWDFWTAKYSQDTPAEFGVVAPGAGGTVRIGSTGGRGVVHPGWGESAIIAFKPTGPGTVSVSIFSLTGKKVYDTRLATSGPDDPGANEVLWRAVNKSGEAVASGVYLVHVRGPGLDSTKKVAIIR